MLATLTVNCLVAVLLAASLTCAVNTNVPALAAAPLMTPVDGSSVRPGAIEPDTMDQTKGDCPPAAVSVCKYAAATDPSGKAPAVEIVRPETAEIVNGLLTSLELLSTLSAVS